MIHSIDVSKSNGKSPKHPLKSNKRLSRSRHSLHRKKPRKSYQRLRDNSNASKKKNRIDSNQSPFDTRSMIQDHLYISILGLLCFFPTGIFGLIRAMQAYEMKRPSSIIYWPKLAAIYGRHALRWAILSILIGTMLWTIFIIYRLLHQQHPVW